jgi:hypothetical protein
VKDLLIWVNPSNPTKVTHRSEPILGVTVLM